MTIVYYFIIVLVYTLDQVSKYFIQSHLAIGQGFHLVSVFSILHVHNTGAAFSILKNNQLLLILIGLIVAVIISTYQHSKPNLPTFLTVGLAFLMGGNLGNLSDRILHGYVVDFIQLPYWPIFNVADIMINLGVALIAIYLIFDHEETTSNTPERHADEHERLQP